MVQVKDVSLNYGSLQFNKAVKEVPPSTEIQGNVTINNMGSPGRQSYFEAEFSISADVEVGGLSIRNFATWRFPIPSDNFSSPYIEIESEAARMIAPALRQLADAVDAEVARFDTEKG